MILGIVFYYYLDNRSNQEYNSINNINKSLDIEVKDRLETNEKNFYIKKFPKNLKFLKYNSELIHILSNIKFIKRFNKTLYGDILLNANKMMRAYIYILAERYDPDLFIPIFIDIKDGILEKLNSLFLIIPKKLKHVYGIEPYKEINKTIEGFMTHSKKMLDILKNFSKLYLKKYYIPVYDYTPYNNYI